MLLTCARWYVRRLGCAFFRLRIRAIRAHLELFTVGHSRAGSGCQLSRGKQPPHVEFSPFILCSPLVRIDLIGLYQFQSAPLSPLPNLVVALFSVRRASCVSIVERRAHGCLRAGADPDASYCPAPPRPISIPIYRSAITVSISLVQLGHP